MLRWFLILFISVTAVCCAGFQAIYVHLLETQLPVADGGRTLHIPALDVHVPVTTFPLGESTWEISPWERNAGQLAHLGWIDTTMNIVIAAHSQYPSGAPGVFAELHTLRPGDVIFVRDANRQRAYIVREIETVDYRDLTPLYPTTDNRLTLITCSIPSYVAAQNLYYERVVVIAYAADD